MPRVSSATEIEAYERLSDQAGHEGVEPGTGSAAETQAPPSLVGKGAGGLGLDLLGVLVDQSLLKQADRPDGEPRFTMLETVREFAAEQLAVSDEHVEVRRRHLAYCCALAEQHESGFQGPDKLAWLDRMGTELPNVRAALGYARDHDAMEDGLRLFGSLISFWRIRGHLQEGRAWGETFLTAHDASPAARAKALYILATIAFYTQRFVVAESLFAESATLFRAAGDEAYQGNMLTYLGATEVNLGEAATARRHAEEGVALCRTAGHTWHLAWAVYFCGIV